VVNTTETEKYMILKNDPAILETVSIFQGIDGGELETMLRCLTAEEKSVPKNGILLLAGDKPLYIGVVLSGLLHVVKEDYDGNRTLIAPVSPGEIFAEALCCAGVDESPITVLAGEDTAVMLLRFDRVLHTCPNACPYHQKLVENILRIVAEKNLYLQDRMEILSLKSVRGKVLRYLEALASKQGRRVTVPFDREQLANYLSVERSALSHELMKMKRDGLIEYRKNNFILLFQQ